MHWAARRIAEHSLIVCCDEQPVPSSFGVVPEPLDLLLDRDRLDVERDGRLADVVVVQLVQLREVGLATGADLAMRTGALAPLVHGTSVVFRPGFRGVLSR
jgi:hypothetical protein